MLLVLLRLLRFRLRLRFLRLRLFSLLLPRLELLVDDRHVVFDIGQRTDKNRTKNRTGQTMPKGNTLLFRNQFRIRKVK